MVGMYWTCCGWQQGCVQVDIYVLCLHFHSLAQTLHFCVSGLSHRFILVQMAKGVVFQDLGISVGSDKCSFIDQAHIYNARGRASCCPQRPEIQWTAAAYVPVTVEQIRNETKTGEWTPKEMSCK